MNPEVKLAIQKLGQAWAQLEEGSARAKDPLEKDGVVQRFEFTFELLWKTLKIFFEFQGVSCKTPRECLKAAFRLGYLSDEKIFLNMLDDRNRMSHMYDKKWAEEIFARIKSEYVIAIKAVLAKIEVEASKS